MRYKGYERDRPGVYFSPTEPVIVLEMLRWVPCHGRGCPIPQMHHRRGESTHTEHAERYWQAFEAHPIQATATFREMAEIPHGDLKL